MRRAVSLFFAAALSFAVLSLAFGGCSRSGMTLDDVPRISKDLLKSRLGDPNTTIIDVRQDGDWQQSDGKIKGAVREDPRQAVESWAGKYPKNGKIVLYCA
jgi:hypothetical protein